MANNPLQGQVLQQEPHFHGGNVKEGLSINQFINTLDGMFATVPADPAAQLAFASRARLLLMGPANTWFFQALPMQFPDQHTQALSSWPALRKLLKTRYAVIQDSADVSTNWSQLRQRDNETPYDFFERVSAKIYEYLLVAPTLPVPPRDDPAFAQTRERIAEQLAPLNNPDQAVIDQITDNQFDTSINMMRYTGTHLRRLLISDIGIKTLSAGLSNPKFREAVRVSERAKEDLGTIGIKIKQLEATTSDARNTRHVAASSSRVARIDDQQDAPEVTDDESVDAVRSRKSQQQQNKKKQQKSKKKYTAALEHSTEATVERPTCDFCGRLGHTEERCYTKENALKAAKTLAREKLASQSRTSKPSSAQLQEQYGKASLNFNSFRNSKSKNELAGGQ